MGRAMKYNRLGKSGLLVSELSFGTWVTFSSSGAEGTVKANSRESAAEACYALMSRSYMAGVNFFDNAEAYANGQAEILMGDAVHIGIERKMWTREDLVLSTKIMFGALPPKGSPEYIPGAMSMNRIGLSRKHVVEGLAASLQRMRLQYVDLVFCHRPDPLTPMEEVVRAFNHVLDRGMAFYWGTSEWSAAQLLEAKVISERLGMVPPLMEQPEYHMLCRQRVEKEYAMLYSKDTLGLGLTTWSPLASGVLTGKYNSGIPAGSRLANDTFKKRPDFESRFMKNVKTAESIRPIAERLGCSMGQLALAWCVKNPNVSTVITGASSVDQVDENLKALEVVDKLTPDVMAEIDTALGSTFVAVDDPVTKQMMTYRLGKLSDGALAKL